MREAFRFYKNCFSNSKKRKKFERDFKVWPEEGKKDFLSHFFNIRVTGNIEKIKVYTAECNIKTAVYTDKGIYKFNLYDAFDGRWDYIGASIVSRRTPLV